MQTNNQTQRKKLITGWIITAIPVLFLLIDGIGKLVKPEPVIKSTLELGYPEAMISTIGIISISCTVLYILPRFSFLGAVLLTGYLGGAVATHLRLENPLFSHILFPVYLGFFIWAGLYFRNQHVKTLLLTNNK
jgi:hypothetical protein